MPGAAAGLADVGAGDPQPLVLGRSAQHLLQQLSVSSLEFGSILQLAAGSADADGERVTDGLEIAEVEHSWRLGEGADAGVDLDARKGIGEEGSELGFEAADLSPQLDSGEPLVAIDSKRRARVSVEQIRHSPKRV